jgi:hypothetical protein
MHFNVTFIQRVRLAGGWLLVAGADLFCEKCIAA